MDKLDRLVWAGGLSFTAFGRTIGVRVNTPEVPDDVLAVLPPGSEQENLPEVELLMSLRLASTESRPGVREFNLLYTRHVQTARSLDRATVVTQLEQEI